MTKKEKMEFQALAGGMSGGKQRVCFQSKGAFWHLGKRLLSSLFLRLQAVKTRRGPGRRVPLLLTEYMALTMREAVDTLPESSSKLCVSLLIVSTLMSGFPSVTPRRPGSKTRAG